MLATRYKGDHSFEVVAGQAIAPGPGEVRLAVGFVGICGTDMHIYHGAMDGRVKPPKTIGHEMSGVVVEIGEGVDDVSIGDRVVVRPLDYCGACPACNAGHSHVCHSLKFMGIDSPGAFQHSWTVKARTLHKLPDNVSLQQGALIEPLSVACHDIARARVVAGEDVVVIGGGPIGQLVAVVAKAAGANVLVSEINPQRRAFAEAQGVKTIDPSTDDLAMCVLDWTNGKGADVVFEVAGVPPAVAAMTEIAAVRGRICVVAIHTDQPKVDLFKFFWKELEMVGARVYGVEDFERAIELVASGAVDVDPFITGVFSLDDIGRAFRTAAEDPKAMKLVVNCGGGNA